MNPLPRKHTNLTLVSKPNTEDNPFKPPVTLHGGTIFIDKSGLPPTTLEKLLIQQESTTNTMTTFELAQAKKQARRLLSFAPKQTHRKLPRKSSKYKYISWNPVSDNWKVTVYLAIKGVNKTKHVGYRKEEHQAVILRNEFCRTHGLKIPSGEQ